ncbi:hypothetical protein JAAARDRAFT_36020 [Jaapia argillacea MUCL 33604]|uniref:Phenazine biosynthesis protein n=1 Tax=Jaapia argillacea MUCL 33604 TaxID=933084 RepID=A0A067PRS1_9AGAM|nr:hypothetical protein JAAARDRAFT_36020 [Jaapia argillacea MUCL 33604]
MPQLHFTTLDVFTTTRYAGNPLAIVEVPSSVTLTPSQEQKIAKEFNLSETVFFYVPNATSAEGEARISIYTTEQELPFAGHPTVGTTYFLLELKKFKTDNGRAALKTQSGRIPITYDPHTLLASVNVAHDVLIHRPYTDVQHLAEVLGLTPPDIVIPLEGGDGVGLASIVKGMTFLLVELRDVGTLGRIKANGQEIVVLGSGVRAGEAPWLAGGFVGIYCFVLDPESGKDGHRKLRTRMFSGSLEDPATGSAACTLGAWMSLTRPLAGKEERFEITQGVEMGRKSDIIVSVVKGEQGLEGVKLEGSAVKVMEGVLEV